MSQQATETLSVVVEREIPFPPEKIWRALTQPQLIEEWLMKNDFKPVVDHRFNLRADWGVCRLSGPGHRAEQDAVLYLGRHGSRERRHLDSHPDGARARICAWSSRASGRISNRPIRAPNSAGRSSLRIWNRSWRGYDVSARAKAPKSKKRHDAVAGRI